jgi:hypothetical protein
MNAESAPQQTYEISPRFRDSIQERIDSLERDAAEDERTLDALDDEDHIRRHRRLITVQRAEALRMKLFLERAQAKLARPMIGY